MLYINPGAAGIVGFHKVRTIVRFELYMETIKNLEVIELKKERIYLSLSKELTNFSSFLIALLAKKIIGKEATKRYMLKV